MWDNWTVRGDYGPSQGVICMNYKGELYDISNHHTRYRSFGIYEEAVRKSVFSSCHPKPYDETSRAGVWPQPDRVKLRWGDQGDDLPVPDWVRSGRKCPPPSRML